MDIKEEIRSESEELVKLRRYFHTRPELGFREFNTSEVVAKHLEESGMEVRSGFAGTGVTGLLRGTRAGKTLLIRSDMDALPVKEETGLPFASRNEGIMHACGHDGHMAMLLTAARILGRHRRELNGNILFLFQPNEEDAGAAKMIEDGAISGLNVDAAMGIHLWSPLHTGTMGINAGPIMAASHYFYLTVTGRGGHAGMPQDAADPVRTASMIMENVQHLQTREMDCIKDPTVIMFCSIHGGTSPVVIPEKVDLQGSIRFLHENGEMIEKRFKEIVSDTCRMTGTGYRLGIVEGNKLLSNDTEMTELVRREGEKILGAENIRSDMRMMVGEDFAEFADRVKSAFYFIGTGNSEKGSDYPHHHPKFTIDEDSLSIGVQFHIATALSYLDKGKDTAASPVES